MARINEGYGIGIREQLDTLNVKPYKPMTARELYDAIAKMPDETEVVKIDEVENIYTNQKKKNVDFAL